MDQLKISEKVTQKDESHQTEKVYRILKAIHTALALLALALAAALTVMTLLLLDLRGENDQLEKVLASSEALRAENKNLMHKVPEAWVVHNGSLYYFSCMDKSWEEAERSCVSLGSHLTSVTSVEEQISRDREKASYSDDENTDFIEHKERKSIQDYRDVETEAQGDLMTYPRMMTEFILKKADGSNYWIGLHLLRHSDWRWTDGTHYNEAKSKEFWAPNEPNNKENNEYCVHFSKNRLQSWNDNNCSLPFLFICKWECKSSGLCP